jgi:hypothetical protein
MQAHITFLDQEFGEVPGLPLFPSITGSIVKKAAVVASFETVATQLEVPLMTLEGSRYMGGHSARVTGARYWVRLGIEVYKIQLMARWKSSIALRYIADAPLQAITGDAIDLQRRRLDVLSDLECLRGDVTALRLALDNMDGITKAHATEHLAVLDAVASDHSERFVINIVSGVYHRLVSFGDQNPDTWKAACGWKFVHAAHAFATTAPTLRVCCCERCFPASCKPVASVQSASSGSD